MPCSRNTDPVRARMLPALWAGAALLLCAAAHGAEDRGTEGRDAEIPGTESRGAEIRIEQARLEMREQNSYLHAILHFELNAEIKRMLSHGIPLHIETELRIQRHRDWLWDETVRQRRIRRQLQYHPLTKRYTVVDQHTKTRDSFSSLEQALARLGRFQRQNVFRDINLPGQWIHHATLHSYLDIESLPTAMRPIAWFSAAWHLSSPPYRWRLSP